MNSNNKKHKKINKTILVFTKAMTPTQSYFFLRHCTYLLNSIEISLPLFVRYFLFNVKISSVFYKLIVIRMASDALLHIEKLKTWRCNTI